MIHKQNFDGLMVSLSSPAEIESWSHGSVESPDTINYRTGKPKSKGLFCESIFGPVRNFECSCGKYKGVRYQGIVCEKCGVEVASSRVRRERMGHIDLASPVIHARYRSNTSGGVHYLLGLSGHEIDRILAFVKYVCVNHISDEGRTNIKESIDKIFEGKKEELDSLYAGELDKLTELKSKKEQDIKAKEYKKIYDENLASLDTERNRLKSIAATIDFGSTILESDYRNFFEYLFRESGNISTVYEDSKEIKEKLGITERETKKSALLDKIMNYRHIGLSNENWLENVVKQIKPIKDRYEKLNAQKINELKSENKKFKEAIKIYNDIARSWDHESNATPSQKATIDKHNIFKFDPKIVESLSKGTANFLINFSVIHEKIGDNGLEKDEIASLIEKLTWSKKDIQNRIDNEVNKIENEIKVINTEIELIRQDNSEELEKNKTLKVVSSNPDFRSGPEAIAKMLSQIDVEKEIKEQIDIFPTIKSKEKKKKAFALIKLLVNLYVSGIKPENMVLRKLPVIPPDLRPVVQLEGGRFASSDVNLFYRRVLMRNIRLKKMIQVGMPDVVKKNEIRLLQESVNNLLVGEKGSDNSRAGVKVFKSLTDMLSGKEGIFRKNLLGKRVDYSGRSVITVGPDLKLNECGVPLYIAVKMFTPFVIGKLIEEKIAYNPKQAEKLIKEEDPLALVYLQEAVKDKYVLLNRAPTLHRLSIEAFKIKLMPGKTIRLHPLVCPSFNADFDGDQMAIHLPISDQAQEEARELIAADKNILVPASGEPTITHSQDMVLGMYYLTNDADASEHIMGRFRSLDDVMDAYHCNNVNIKDKISLIRNGDVIETTVGRVVFNMVLPESMRFVNKTLTKKDLKKTLSIIYDECGRQATVEAADGIKDLGFKYATQSSTSINVTDMIVPPQKEELINSGEDKANEIYSYFYKGFLSEKEKHRLITDMWNTIKNQIEDHIKVVIGPGNDMHTMTNSGARGSISNTTQISGMKGLVLNQLGEIIELPIKRTYAEGLTPIEYFITAHGGRKGKADTALRTAESGYLTRKLCDSSQEVVVRQEDCGTTQSLIVSRQDFSESAWEEQLYGRIVAQDVTDEHGTVLVPANEAIDKPRLKSIINANVDTIHIRSALTCHTVSGVCQKCYGFDLSTRSMVQLGTPVGIIAAQSIGEPATQLTLNTFHAGGVAGGSEEGLASGIERIKQLFEIRQPKNPALIAPFDGTIHFSEKGKKRMITVRSDYQKVPYFTKDGYEVIAKKGDFIKKGGAYAIKGRSKLKIQESGVVLDITTDAVIIGVIHEYTKALNNLSPLKNQEGDEVYKGEILTNGSLDIRAYKDIVGDLEAQQYIIRETDKVYASQGGGVNPRHVEVVVKQMFSKVFIEDTGDSSFVPGDSIKYEVFRQVNEQLKAQGKRVAEGERRALGLTTIAKETDSWLSAASFQETVRVMVEASLRGAIDELFDLKSNVIIGRLLPVGEIFRKKYAKEQAGTPVESGDTLVDTMID